MKQESCAYTGGVTIDHRSLAFRLTALLVSTALALLLLEIGLRAFYGSDYFYPYFPGSVRHFYPSEEITPGVSGVSRFSTSSFGTRGREPSGDESLTILTIGGSTTADTVLDDSEAWPARLEARLNEAVGSGRVWVANAGVDGLNSQHHLMHAIYLLPRLPPIDYVIVYAGSNDLGLWFNHRELAPDYLDIPDNWNARIAEAFRWSQYTPPDWPVYKRTALWKAASRAKDRFLTARALEAEDRHVIVQDAQLRWLEEERARRQEAATELLPRAKLETLPLALAGYGETLGRIADEIRANGSEPIFMTQAVQAVFENDAERGRVWMGALHGGEAYVSEDQIPELLGSFNARMFEVASEKGVAVLDLPARLAPDGALFYDGMHFNEAGADAAAAAIAEFFGERGFLDELPEAP